MGWRDDVCEMQSSLSGSRQGRCHIGRGLEGGLGIVRAVQGYQDVQGRAKAGRSGWTRHRSVRTGAGPNKQRRVIEGTSGTARA